MSSYESSHSSLSSSYAHFKQTPELQVKHQIHTALLEASELTPMTLKTVALEGFVDVEALKKGWECWNTPTIKMLLLQRLRNLFVIDGLEDGDRVYECRAGCKSKGKTKARKKFYDLTEAAEHAKSEAHLYNVERHIELSWNIYEELLPEYVRVHRCPRVEDSVYVCDLCDRGNEHYSYCELLQHFASKAHKKCVARLSGEGRWVDPGFRPLRMIYEARQLVIGGIIQSSKHMKKGYKELTDILSSVEWEV